MAEFVGKNAYIAFKSTQLTDFRDFQMGSEMGLVDASAGADAANTYLSTREDGSSSITLLLQTGGTATTAYVPLLAEGAEGTLEYGPEGTASGKPKYTVNAIVKNPEISNPYEDVVQLDVEWQHSDASGITRGTY